MFIEPLPKRMKLRRSDMFIEPLPKIMKLRRSDMWTNIPLLTELVRIVKRLGSINIAPLTGLLNVPRFARKSVKVREYFH
jgi:hypothetical protein